MSLHLLQGLLLGGGLGLVFGFLRPVRPRWLADLIFLIALFWAWLWLGFGLCRGDLRLAYSLSLLVGAGFWEFTFGENLKPVFSFFWKQIFRIIDFILLPGKNISKKAGLFINFLFARSQKWVTIKCNLHSSRKTKNRRNTHGKANPLPSDPTGLPP